jgi:solute carrier family 12 sodium/potassium/chloride transporter 2
MKDIMFIIMLASLTNFLTGSIMGPSSETEEARGFIGYSSMYTG